MHASGIVRNYESKFLIVAGTGSDKSETLLHRVMNSPAPRRAGQLPGANLPIR